MQVGGSRYCGPSGSFVTAEIRPTIVASHIGSTRRFQVCDVFMQVQTNFGAPVNTPQEGGSMDTVRHILQIKGTYIWSISPDETVYEALRMMANKDVGALLVMENEKLAGILSERDYARKIILQGKTSKDTKVREIMTSTVHTVHPDQTIEECMAMMTRHRVRHLPVMENGRLLGIISIGDVVNDIIRRQRQTISDLESRMLSSETEPPEPAVPRFPSIPKEPK
jgi:CBS domain-containing protein